MRALLFFVMAFSFYSALGQTISGYVYDEAENKPLEGAFVYLDGTTISASTDSRGFFKITTPQKYNTTLVISYVGFEDLVVQEPYSYGKPFKVLLREDAIKLQEVVITKGGPFSRRAMLAAFRKQFLGMSDAGSSCKIENESDIVLYYSTTDNTLHAMAYKPIIINNKRLEYKLAFTLSDFTVHYNMKTLNEQNAIGSFFAGTTFFTDVATKEITIKRRKGVYEGSTMHLMKTIAANDWENQKFALYADKLPASPSAYFSVTDSLDYKKVTLIDIPASVKKNRAEVAKLNLRSLAKKEKNNSEYSDVKFVIMYKNSEQTEISFNRGYFYIDHNWLFFPINEIIFSGYMGTLKAGDLLPTDYVYTPM